MKRLPTILASAAIVVIALGSGCGKDAKVTEVPTFVRAAEANRARVASLERIWSRATVQVRYTDDSGARRFEQGEGHLRMEMPSHVALSAGKVGQTLFWLGCDDRRAWWIDLTGDTPTARVGEHGGPGQASGGLASLISPRLLPRLMGLTTPAADGVIRVSDDRRLVGVTTRIDGGYERRWLNPATLEPASIELWDDQRRPILVAELSEYTNLELETGGGDGPRIPTRVAIGHRDSGTEIRLYLSGARDGTRSWEPGAFEFDRLIGSLGVRRVIDLDVPEGGKQSY